MSKLARYLLNSNTTANVVNDIYWNDVVLLLKLDAESNTLGLPFFKDYSRYQRYIKEVIGSDSQSRITTYLNDGDNVRLLANSDVSVLSYGYLGNKFNHAARLAEINAGVLYKRYTTTIAPSCLRGSQKPIPLGIGTSDFTIEFSFYADEVNLPWAWQTIFSVGNPLRLQNSNPQTVAELKTYIVASSDRNGWGVFLKNNSLMFLNNGTEYLVSNTPLLKNTFYHICIQRTGSLLKCFVNTILTNLYNFNGALQDPAPDNILEGLHLGSCTIFLNSFFGSGFVPSYSIDVSFSGGLSNLRITKTARYPGNFYTLTLPFKTNAVENKIDPEYNNVIYNLPLLYDYYDYSKYNAHFNNKLYLKGAPNFNSGFLPITGLNSYKSSNINTNLSSSEWTIECFIAKTINGQLEETYKGVIFGNSSLINNDSSFGEWLTNYQIRTINNVFQRGGYVTTYNLVSLSTTEPSKKILDVNFNIVNSNDSRGIYFSIKASLDGDTWVNFPLDENVNWGGVLLPNNEIKIYAEAASPSSISGLTVVSGQNQVVVPSAYAATHYHFAVSRYNNFLYCLINGNVVRAVPFNYTLHSLPNSTSVTIGAETFEPLVGRRNQDPISTLGIAIKGLKITNKAIYSFISINDVQSINSTQPLALSSGSIRPPRARVIDLIKTDISVSIDSPTASWTVYVSQPVDNLTVADFTLIGVGGITGYAISSLVKVSDYSYTLVANTGTGNGELTATFNDRKTVKYKDTNNLISYSVGELSIEGEAYLINKSAPLPLLSSGSAPYVSDRFIVKLVFNAAISTFDNRKIGVTNGVIANIQLLNELTQEYAITIDPVKEGVVTVKCLRGAGITGSGILSDESATFVRIFASSFPILQMPLNIATGTQDLSPSRLLLDDVIDNNTEYSFTVFPTGENSSLYVNPAAEKSGLIYPGYNSTGSTTSILSEDWTIEFFARVVSNTGQRAHILSIENPSSGISIVGNNGFLQIQRNIESNNNLLGSARIQEVDSVGYIAWTNNSFSSLQKYPHFAFTKKGDVYRLYRNGVRVALVQSSINIDITRGDLKIGYYANRVADAPYWLSNVRITLGKALYTSLNINIPSIPYSVLPNITEETELLSYISIYSSNPNSSVARVGDVIYLKFLSIVTLTSTPSVQILNRAATVSQLNGLFTAQVQVLEQDSDSEVIFSITVANQVNIPSKTFTNTTNGSKVVVDNDPLTVSITSDSPNDNSYLIDAQVILSEEASPLSLSNFTTSNCIVSNLLKYINSNTYSFNIKGLNTGSVSVSLPANTITDKAGNFNTASNVFTRNVVVPTYVPDAHFDKVVLLIQSPNSIIDESFFTRPITATNVELSSTQAPIGSTKSLYFNGLDSSLTVDLNNSLPGNLPYTIEMYLYFSSKVVFRLPVPSAKPASNVTTSSFTANWGISAGATGYIVDVANDSLFLNKLPSYDNRLTENSTSLTIEEGGLNSRPTAQPSRYKSTTGFLAEWESANVKEIGFRYDVSLNSLFTKPLYLHTNKFTSSTTVEIGELGPGMVFNNSPATIPVVSNTLSPGPFSNEKGVLFSGILANANYPKLYYFLEESSLRLYDKGTYTIPAIAEDIDNGKWYHVAICNTTKYTYLYVDGAKVDKVKNTSWSDNVDVGYSIGRFNGFLTGLRITKGLCRYTSDFVVPTLPFPTN